jgi:hypothetical protein
MGGLERDHRISVLDLSMLQLGFPSRLSLDDILQKLVRKTRFSRDFVAQASSL